MASKAQAKKKPLAKAKTPPKNVGKGRTNTAAVLETPAPVAISPLAAKPNDTAREREARERRREALHQMLLRKISKGGLNRLVMWGIKLSWISIENWVSL